jgi:Flp pilus assembly protein TadD
MPPWLPESGYGSFADEERLSEQEIDLIEAWVQQGAPEGIPGTKPPVPSFAEGWQLGPPDLILKASKPHVVSAEGKDVFWNFILTPKIEKARWVRAVEIRPGDRRLFHHANLLIDSARSSRRRESGPGAGFAGMDLSIESDTFDPDSDFLFWKPGSLPQVEPEGMAWKLEPGTDLVLNVHVQPSGKAEVLEPSIGLYFTDQPRTKFPMLIQLEHDDALRIPVGDASFEVSDDFALPLDVRLLAVYPHAHYLGKLLEGYATLPNGKREWLIRIPDWNLDWQAVYRYRDPVLLPKGTVLSMRYRYNNSAANPRNPFHPPRLVVGGNQATDEMGHLWFQVLPEGKKDQRTVLEDALMRHRLEKNPSDFAALFNLGALRLAQQDPDHAIRFLTQAVQFEPNHPVALNTLGAALLFEGKGAEALPYFRRSLEADPHYVNARYNLANTLADLGNFGEAIAEFKRVLAESPSDAAAREHLQMALKEYAADLTQSGQWEAAVAPLRDLVNLDASDSAAHHTLAVALRKQGKIAEARKEFTEAIQTNPNDQGAREALKELRNEPR